MEWLHDGMFHDMLCLVSFRWISRNKDIWTEKRMHLKICSGLPWVSFVERINFSCFCCVFIFVFFSLLRILVCAVVQRGIVIAQSVRQRVGLTVFWAWKHCNFSKYLTSMPSEAINYPGRTGLFRWRFRTECVSTLERSARSPRRYAFFCLVSKKNKNEWSVMRPDYMKAFWTDRRTSPLIEMQVHV